MINFADDNVPKTCVEYFFLLLFSQDLAVVDVMKRVLLTKCQTLSINTQLYEFDIIIETSFVGQASFVAMRSDETARVENANQIFPPH
jgi:hypothetical protein